LSTGNVPQVRWNRQTEAFSVRGATTVPWLAHD
jgi:hypothetical protein